MAISNWIKGPLEMLVLTAVVAMLSLSPLSAQDIYKTVDENGNTVYTDQKPSDDAVPVKLRELTVVDPVELGDEQVIAGADDDDGDSQATDFGLQIVSPEPEETIWNTAYVLSVQVATDRDLPSGTRLAYMIDGEVYATSRSTSIELEEVYRGEHQLSVELQTPDGRVLGQAGPVTFYMHQHSRQHPNPG
ncbi:MAG: DUF4124 domain-containing protein [Wenzhouxiangellaceae bacterium]